MHEKVGNNREAPSSAPEMKLETLLPLIEAIVISVFQIQNRTKTRMSIGLQLSAQGSSHQRVGAGLTWYSALLQRSLRINPSSLHLYGNLGS